MESKVSLKDRIRRTRSLIFSFGSQKPTPTENQPRHPYFRGPPGRQNQLLVLRVDRQYLPCEVERELKYACYRLARNVERGIPSVDLNHRPEAKPEPESGSGPGARSDGLDLPASKGGNNNSNKSNENKPRPQSSSLPCTLRSAKGRYASGTTTQSYGQHKFDPAPWQRWSALMMPSELDTEADTEICSDSSRIPSSSTKSEGRDVVVSAAQGQGQVQAQAQTQVQDMLFSSGETLVANDPNSHAGNGGTGTSSAGGQDKWPNVRVPADIKDDPQTENLCENNDPAPVPTSMSTIPDTTAPPVAPSLSRPDEESTPSPSSSSSLPRLVRKRAVENLHDESVREGHNPNPNTNPSPGPGLGLGYRQSTGGTTTTTIPPKSQNHAPSAPRARYSWLPKTKTGLRPASTIELGAACRRQSAAAGGGEPAAAQEASVIIDSNGVRHTISAAEEAARDEDLRDAVREKMATGRIRAKPQPQPQPQPRTGTGTGTGTGVRAKPRPVSMSTSGTAFGTVAGNNGKTGRRAASSPFTCLDGSHGKSCAAASASVVAGSAPGLGVGLGTGNGNANANANANGNGPKAKDTTSGRSPFQPTKRRSILHKLSFLGFGRQKGKDVVGFGRMVEAA